LRKKTSKELFEVVVVPVVQGKVEIWRRYLTGLEMGRGRVLEILEVNLRASGKLAERGSDAYRGFHGSHNGTEKACGFVGLGRGI